MARGIAVALTLAVVALLAYLTLWPVSIAPVAWDPPKPRSSSAPTP